MLAPPLERRGMRFLPSLRCSAGKCARRLCRSGSLTGPVCAPTVALETAKTPSSAAHKPDLRRLRGLLFTFKTPSLDADYAIGNNLERAVETVVVRRQVLRDRVV